MTMGRLRVLCACLALAARASAQDATVTDDEDCGESGCKPTAEQIAQCPELSEFKFEPWLSAAPATNCEYNRNCKASTKSMCLMPGRVSYSQCVCPPGHCWNAAESTCAVSEKYPWHSGGYIEKDAFVYNNELTLTVIGTGKTKSTNIGIAVSPRENAAGKNDKCEDKFGIEPWLKILVGTSDEVTSDVEVKTDLPPFEGASTGKGDCKEEDEATKACQSRRTKRKRGRDNTIWNEVLEFKEIPDGSFVKVSLNEDDGAKPPVYCGTSTYLASYMPCEFTVNNVRITASPCAYYSSGSVTAPAQLLVLLGLLSAALAAV